MLERFHQVALRDAGGQPPEHVTSGSLTADCPLLDWGVIDRVIITHLEGSYDYTTNICAVPTRWVSTSR